MVELFKPTASLLDSYLDFVEEMRKQGEKVWDNMIPKSDENPRQFVERLNNEELSPGLDLVPQSTYWGVLDGVVVGRIALRHHLNEKLMEFGGHIGYEVRPSYRLRGIAKEMLRKIIETPRAKEIGRILLTCDPANIGSNRTIIANGGVLEKTSYVESCKRDTNYYWIKTKR